MTKRSKITFHEAIQMGEYYPEFLSKFPEWENFSKHTQLQYIREALDNRRHQLLQQWAEVYNTLDFTKKPHLLEVANNIKRQLDQIEIDREKLYLEYSK